MTMSGSVAAGHPLTAEAAASALRLGGNAFDAVLAGLCAACVTEPVLASLGGGGFLLARPAGKPPVLYDFFTQTPRHRRSTDSLDFYPILADFGDAEQEFHIGLGSIATPGAVAGLFAIHRELCRLPLAELAAPAIGMARSGIEQNPFQHAIAEIVAPIIRASPESFALHSCPERPGELAAVGERVPMPDLANALDALVRGGEDLFYRGEWAARLARDCRERGGHLDEADLAGYRVERRAPLVRDYQGATVYTNPPPAQGGLLIGFTLGLMARANLGRLARGSAEHLHALAAAQSLTQDIRRDPAFRSEDAACQPDRDLLARYSALMDGAARFSRGTTQISVADAQGNLASLTLSNGEGAGYVLPGTGIVLNNMLGEEDINPDGFHRWPPDRRISSMMSPTLLALPDGTWVVTGSSGSNRIRSAILQVISNLVDFGLDLEAAVAAPRIHFEGDLLNLEPPIDGPTVEALAANWPNLRLWNRGSVFFGGAHSVAADPSGLLTGAGDPRRGGVVLLVD